MSPPNREESTDMERARVGSPRGAADPAVAERALLESASSSRPPSDVDATIVVDVGTPVAWTARIGGGRIEIATGTAEHPDVRILSDPETLATVVSGQRSGVEAFLKGRLRVRGNLALALRLDSIFHPGPRHVRWPRSQTIRAGRLHTSYLEGGTGEPVILLHGLGATNASFLPTMWSLARDHRVLAPDLPGFGDSAKPIRPYDPAFFASWLRDFMDSVGVKRAHVIGNSMGGRVALEIAMRHPERVDRIVLLCPSPAFIKGREFVRVVRFLRPELALIPVPISHRQVVRSTRAIFARPERLPYAWYEAAADEFLRVFSTPRGRIAFFSAARQIYLEEPWGETGFWDRLHAVKAPALFVWGDRDWLVPARFARHVTDALPRSASVVLEDCGHVPQYELPRKTDRLVRDFLEAPPPDAGPRETPPNGPS
jgi:pimeloyl-ACP methyl ester carboxylesterase